jgi:hypothetical protein
MKRGSNKNKRAVKLGEVIEDLLEVQFFDDVGQLGVLGRYQFRNDEKIDALRRMLKALGVTRADDAADVSVASSASASSSSTTAATAPQSPPRVFPEAILAKMPTTLEKLYISIINPPAALPLVGSASSSSSYGAAVGNMSHYSGLMLAFMLSGGLGGGGYAEHYGLDNDDGYSSGDPRDY